MKTIVIIALLLIIAISLLSLFWTRKFFSRRFMVDRLKYYLLLSLLFSVCVTSLISFIPTVQLTVKSTLLIVILLFFTTFLFMYLKDYFDFKLQSHLFSQQGDLELSLYAFFQKAKHETKVSSLIHYRRSVLGRSLR